MPDLHQGHRRRVKLVHSRWQEFRQQLPYKPAGYRLAVTGGRDFTDQVGLRSALNMMLADLRIQELIVGDAHGVDEMARWWAWDRCIAVDKHVANWNRDGIRAGNIRNAQMAALLPDFLLAFPGGRGTADMVARCQRLQIPVYRPWEELGYGEKHGHP